MLDVLIAGGDVYDGSGGEPLRADVGVVGDRVAVVRRDLAPEAAAVIDATGKAVCPGFINILSHSYFSILHDPRSLGELTQGVTTEVFGEGMSMGPLTPRMKAGLRAPGRPGLRGAPGPGYRSTSATWSGAAPRRTSRRSSGAARSAPTPSGTPTGPRRMPNWTGCGRSIAEEMADGALGIASALIYPPGSYAGTAELTELCKVAAGYDGCYASHVRGEGETLDEAITEFLGIVRDAGLRGEVFHLKASGRPNWHRMDGAIELIERSRATGAPVTADVYPYTASSTGLTSIIPGRYHEGGADALYDRLGDPRVRAEIRAELSSSGRWGDVTEAENVLILQARREENRRWQGRTLAEIAAATGADPIEAAMDLIASDRTRIQVAFFSMSEENLRAALARPWVAISSDGMSMAPEGAFLRAPTHPRAYGSFARVLGHYARDEKVLPLTEAIRRMSALPAATLGLRDRGVLRAGFFADVVVFDPATVGDRATFGNPHQLSAGVSEVLVNGKVTISNGTFTGELAGRALAGPGARR